MSILVQSDLKVGENFPRSCASSSTQRGEFKGPAGGWRDTLEEARGLEWPPRRPPTH